MKIIISPAKKMNAGVGSLPHRSLPVFADRAERILSELKSMDYDALKKLWAASDAICRQNVERLEHMDLKNNLTPAILAYEGIQYQKMAPGIFTDREFEYVEEHLRILSGFYGILRPFDGVVPYRLEMQAKLPLDGRKDLYAWWGDSIAEELLRDGGTIVNLASQEYSRAVEPFARGKVPFVTCIFGEKTGDKIIEKGTRCKMARGEMVRFMAENDIRNVEDIRAFAGQGFQYSPEDSDPETYVFVQKENQ